MLLHFEVSSRTLVSCEDCGCMDCHEVWIVTHEEGSVAFEQDND